MDCTWTMVLTGHLFISSTNKSYDVKNTLQMLIYTATSKSLKVKLFAQLNMQDIGYRQSKKSIPTLLSLDYASSSGKSTPILLLSPRLLKFPTIAKEWQA